MSDCCCTISPNCTSCQHTCCQQQPCCTSACCSPNMCCSSPCCNCNACCNCCEEDCEPENCGFIVENLCPSCMSNQRIPCCPNGGTTIPWLQARIVANENCVDCCDNSVPVDACRAVYTCRLPERAKSCKPRSNYKPPAMPFEPETIYNQSYLPCENRKRKPCLQTDNLCLGVGQFEKNTIQKLSYIPFCQIPDCFITPFPNYVEIIREGPAKKKKKKKRQKECVNSEMPCGQECYEFCINNNPACQSQTNNSNVYNCYNNYVPWYSIMRQCGEC